GYREVCPGVSALTLQRYDDSGVRFTLSIDAACRPPPRIRRSEIGYKGYLYLKVPILLLL
ncbi:hypothetical protein, partial [uncultured Muribaculum sp.]|uniref:hypothetical protein n=1 Tax=uncultured Muribaculum sp. TaxID=1918613 RepID=UPI0025B6742F